MKNCILFSACVLFAQVLFSTTAFSQITITSSDYQKNLNIAIKTVQYSSSDTSGLRSVLAASGANKTWNVAGRIFTVSDTSISTLLNKSSSGAPQQNNSAFSSATMVVQRRISSKPLFTNWSYESLTANELRYHGYVQDSAGIVMSNQTNAPSWCSQRYPTTYSSAWSWASTVTATSGNVGITTSMTGNDIIDAYGTIITPEGSFACLRVKSKVNILFGFFTITSYSYEFIDQNRTYARIGADATGDIPGGVTYYRQTSPTGISETPNSLPHDCRLSQNYPNPFNPSTIITYQLPMNSLVSLKVYDILGREVATLVHGFEEAGYKSVEFNASGVASGVYFYRLQAGGVDDVKKLIVQK